jgi:hypothetical protein
VAVGGVPALSATPSMSVDPATGSITPVIAWTPTLAGTAQVVTVTFGPTVLRRGEPRGRVLGVGGVLI